MLLGDFEAAWRESDFIEHLGVKDENRLSDGRSWHGKAVMLRCLHGLGDTIQFIRYAPLLRKECAKLLVKTQPELLRLIASVPGIDEVHTWGPAYKEEPSTWDVQIEINELPRLFRTSLKTIPSFLPYLFVPNDRLLWASQWFPDSHQARVGVAWQASAWDTSRSISLSNLSEVLRLPGLHFYSLQRDTKADLLRQFPQLYNVVAHARDVFDTAALISHLDLVITVDTMIAHLAGALAKTVWIMLPHAADWRWMLNSSSSPWYPTARLLRQRSPGDWSQPVTEIIRSLKQQVI